MSGFDIAVTGLVKLLLVEVVLIAGSYLQLENCSRRRLNNNLCVIIIFIVTVLSGCMYNTCRYRCG